MESRFNRHADRLVERHGEKVWRLGIDAGFTCPHREAGRGRGGCAFCSPEAGLATYQHEGIRVVTDIEEQIARAVGFTRSRYGARLFFLYFQAYSCTNLPPEELRLVYDRSIAILESMAPGSLRGIVVSTRPDCFDGEKAALLAAYAASGLEVWLEFGLQSSNDETLRRIHRGHLARDYAEAVAIAGQAGLRRAVHVMLGLPGEGRRQMLDTIEFVAACGGEGIKFHDLRLAIGSPLAHAYLAGEFAPLHPARLPGLLADCLEILPPGFEVMRLSADFRPGEAIDIFPASEKTRLYMAVEAELRRRGTRQGDRS
ncbi:MAG TPA: TIGR01212 family radical SAM protein [Rectinemataceae bacterium]|nr:TIGR01212 family radical SAM protein [Rectinemataceae bacterium]